MGSYAIFLSSGPWVMPLVCLVLYPADLQCRSRGRFEFGSNAFGSNDAPGDDAWLS